MLYNKLSFHSFLSDPNFTMASLGLLAVSILALLLPSVPAFCPSNCCIDECFTKAPCEDQETTYKKIFDIVQVRCIIQYLHRKISFDPSFFYVEAARGARLAYRTQGTVFTYGGSVGADSDDDLPLFIPRLAALVSLAINAGCRDNPALIVQHTFQTAL